MLVSERGEMDAECLAPVWYLDRRVGRQAAVGANFDHDYVKRRTTPVDQVQI